MGENPVSGGRPPEETRDTRIVGVTSGNLCDVCDNDSTVVVVFKLNIMNTVIDALDE